MNAKFSIYVIVGKALDEVKHDLVSNYFPDHAVDDFTSYSGIP